MLKHGTAPTIGRLAHQVAQYDSSVRVAGHALRDLIWSSSLGRERERAGESAERPQERSWTRAGLLEKQARPADGLLMAIRLRLSGGCNGSTTACGCKPHAVANLLAHNFPPPPRRSIVRWPDSSSTQAVASGVLSTSSISAGKVLSKEVGKKERGARGGVDRRSLSDSESDNATSVRCPAVWLTTYDANRL